jgi:hypothetical protein
MIIDFYLMIINFYLMIINWDAVYLIVDTKHFEIQLEIPEFLFLWRSTQKEILISEHVSVCVSSRSLN